MLTLIINDQMSTTVEELFSNLLHAVGTTISTALCVGLPLSTSSVKRFRRCNLPAKAFQSFPFSAFYNEYQCTMLCLSLWGMLQQPMLSHCFNVAILCSIVPLKCFRYLKTLVAPATPCQPYANQIRMALKSLPQCLVICCSSSSP